MTIFIDDLPDDLVCNILEPLTNNQLLSVEAVNRCWRRCVRVMLSSRVEVIRTTSDRLDSLATCWHLNKGWSSVFTINLRQLLNAHPKQILGLMKRFENVLCLDLSNVRIEAVDFIMQITNVFPRLECLSLDKVNASDKQWRRFAYLGSQLIHLSIYREFRPAHLEVLMQCCNNLQAIYLEGDVNEVDKIMALKQCTSKCFDVRLKIFGSSTNWTREIAEIVAASESLAVECALLETIGCHFSVFINLKKLEIIGKPINITTKVISFPLLEFLQFDYIALNLISKFKLSKLIKLKISQIKEVDEEEVEKENLQFLFNQLEDLRELTIEGQICPKNLSNFLTKVTNLHKLVLRVTLFNGWHIELLIHLLEVLQLLPFKNTKIRGRFFNFDFSLPINTKQIIIELMASLRQSHNNSLFDVRFEFACRHSNQLEEWQSVINQNGTDSSQTIIIQVKAAKKVDSNLKGKRVFMLLVG